VSPGDRPQRPRRPRHIQVAFDAFYGQHHHTWRQVAYVHTGSYAAAEDIADEVTEKLDQTWEDVLQRKNVAQHAWCVLKVMIMLWQRVHGAESRFVQTAAFSRTARAMAYAREQFDLMEESLGLYSAIAALPERQFDVIVLRYTLEYANPQIANIMGITETTVRSHLRHARMSLESSAAQRRILHTTGTEG
jgi:RNA polymerase sigma factor (sigma-70 family)